MTGWLVVAAAVLTLLPGSAAQVRLARLGSAGRIAAPAARGTRARRARLQRHRVRGLVPAAGGLVAGVGTAPAVGLLPAVGVAAAAATCGALVGRARTVRRQEAAEAAALRALRLCVTELEAGAGPSVALAAAAEVRGPAAGRFARAALAIERGGDPIAVWSSDRAGLAAVGVAVQVAARTGAGLAGVLGKVADDLAERARVRRTVAAALAGPRASAALLAGLPVLGLLLGVAMDADPVGFLTGSAGGQAVAAAGLLLDVAGLWWVDAVLRRARPS